MKNKIIKNFSKKINDALEHMEVIEPDMEKLSDKICEMIEYHTGRVVFVGAGISADMAKIIIDEMWFNFQIPEGKFVSITAAKSFSESVEKWKELEELHQTVIFELEEIQLNEKDILIGLSSSGKTKYVLSALDYAMQNGCETALITDMDNTPMNDKVTYRINTNFNTPTVIGLNTAEGSTVQKIILDNVLYLAMEKSGRIYKDTLVYMRPVSEKISQYCLNVIKKLLNVDQDEAIKIFNKHNNSLEITLIAELNNISATKAKELLIKYNGNFNKIIK